MDWLWLLLLALLCTTLAYVFSIDALKELSAFTASLSINLEPVYGILMAIWLFNEDKEVGSGFYYGTLIILSSLVLNAWLSYRERKREASH